MRTLTFRLDTDDFKRVVEDARNEGLSLNAYVKLRLGLSGRVGRGAGSARETGVTAGTTARTSPIVTSNLRPPAPRRARKERCQHRRKPEEFCPRCDE